MAVEFARFEELPPELQLNIMDVTVVSSELRAFTPPLRYVSNFMMAFASKVTAGPYCDALRTSMKQDRQSISVIVNDYNFHNFKALLTTLRNTDGTDGLRRFSFTHSGTNPLDDRDRHGAHFKVTLNFTDAFTSSNEDNLYAYLRSVQALQKAQGGRHIRIFYKVLEGKRSMAFEDMLGRMTFDDSAQGQMKFLLAALQKEFAFDYGAQNQGVVPRGWDIASNINYAFARNEEEDAYWLRLKWERAHIGWVTEKIRAQAGVDVKLEQVDNDEEGNDEGEDEDDEDDDDENMMRGMAFGVHWEEGDEYDSEEDEEWDYSAGL
ncbi:hypothetical protein LTR56_024411 [Elasticomyces elasticus]|nr:hypothetical protein LTR56_024411 [Elasticomyces elasticus]KAK3622923.1 hypothetical protein LTR22_024602 [Elasticomyces elasticus]KAK4905628.1 hypothetical protein LTR49_025106 [Elasticomyces elasticus]